MTVRFADPEPNGLADLVGRLIEANLERRPRSPGSPPPVGRRARGLRRRHGRHRRAVRGHGRDLEHDEGSTPHLRVMAGADDLLELSSAPLRFGFPDALDPRGRSVLRRIVRRDVRVSGMVRHPIRLSRFTRLLSVVP